MTQHCHGPCEQGRKACPTPEACELQDDDDRQVVFMAAVVAVVTLVMLVTVVFA